MEKTKKLSVNTALCDMTEITEERLSQYSAIAINAAAVIQSEKSAFLISKYPVEINTACVIKVPDGINLIIKNGSIEMNEKALRLSILSCLFQEVFLSIRLPEKLWKAMKK